MPFQEDFTEFLDERDGFACEVRIKHGRTRAYAVKGILVSEFMAIDEGLAGFDEMNTCFECASSDVSGIRQDDLLQTTDGTIYKIKQIQNDGTGWTKLGLERQDQ